MKNKVIILGSHFNALSMAQIFGLENIETVIMSNKKSHAGRSKYAKWVKCPCPLSSPNKFIDFLENYCKKEKDKPVVVPSMDQWAFLLAKSNLEEKNLAYSVVDDISTLSLLLNKDQFNHFCEEKQFSIPRIFDLDNYQNIPDQVFPVVAKPNFRMSPDKGNEEENSDLSAKVNRYRLRKFIDSEELKKFIDTTAKEILNLLVLQEYIEGNSDCMITYGVYCKNGEILGSFEGRKVRGYPYDYGDCMVGKQETAPKFIQEEASKVLKAIEYNGIAEVEYKKDSLKGTYHLIEINPRSWSWVGVTQYTKYNLPLMAYRSKLGLKLEENPNEIKDKEVYFRRKTYDRFNCLYRYKKSFPKWSFSAKEWRESFENKFVYDIETAHKDYWQWIYTWAFNNLVLYINWFIRNK